MKLYIKTVCLCLKSVKNVQIKKVLVNSYKRFLLTFKLFWYIILLGNKNSNKTVAMWTWVLTIWQKMVVFLFFVSMVIKKHMKVYPVFLCVCGRSLSKFVFFVFWCKVINLNIPKKSTGKAWERFRPEMPCFYDSVWFQIKEKSIVYNWSLKLSPKKSKLSVKKVVKL